MLSELDQIANQNHLQLVKAIIPHLPRARQKTFSVLIKIIEIQNVLKYYALPFPRTAAKESHTSGEPSADLLDILTDIREHCEGEEQAMIDQALQMLSMIELYSLFAQQEGENHE